MILWIITVKLARNPKHDPTNKKIGKCPISLTLCSDITGQHHSFMISSKDNVQAEEIMRKFCKQHHITRIEEAHF